MSDAVGHGHAGRARSIHLSERLKAARHDRGLSQAQAARELEVARSAYRLWEMAVALPAPRRWRAVAQWLGVTVTTLLLAEGLLSEDEAPERSSPAAFGGDRDRPDHHPSP